jgi:hypothetical protein
MSHKNQNQLNYNNKYKNGNLDIKQHKNLKISNYKI